VIIAWVGIKLLFEWAHSHEWIAFEIPRWFSLGLIIVIFAGAYLYARRHAVPIDAAAEAGAEPPDDGGA